MEPTSADREMIGETVRGYYDGTFHADEDKLRTVFHPDACIIGHFEGELVWNSLDSFIDFVKSAPAPSGQEGYDWRIEAIDTTGDAATIKVVDQYLGLWFTDYLTALKLDDRWVIVNKAFYAHPAT